MFQLSVRSASIAALCYLACFSSAVPSLCHTNPQTKTVVNVTDKDNDGKVNLTKGSMLIVRLEAQLGTGFGWQVVKNSSNGLRQLGKPGLETTDSSSLGRIEVQVFRFKPRQAGSYELELHYKRPWEKDRKPAKTFRLTVRVR